MPGFDGTGPAGMGPRTGGGRGFCSPGAGTYYVTRGAGRGGIPRGGGRGRAWGGGRGRWWYGQAGYNYAAPPYGAYEPYAEPSVAQEMEFLKNQSSFLEQELEQVRRRLDELSLSKDKAK